MINVKEAVQSAVAFVTNLYDETERVNLSLEEVELSETSEYWYITLGYTRPVKVSPPKMALPPLQSYSSFKVGLKFLHTF